MQREFSIQLQTPLRICDVTERLKASTDCQIWLFKEHRYKGMFTDRYPSLSSEFFFFSRAPENPNGIAICFNGSDEPASKCSAVRFLADVLECFDCDVDFRDLYQLHYLRNGSQTILLRNPFWTDECRELISRHHPIANVFVPVDEIVMRTDEHRSHGDHYQRYQPGCWQEGYLRGTVNGRKATIHVIREPSGYCYEDDVYWDVWADEFRNDKSQDV